MSEITVPIAGENVDECQTPIQLFLDVTEYTGDVFSYCHKLWILEVCATLSSIDIEFHACCNV